MAARPPRYRPPTATDTGREPRGPDLRSLVAASFTVLGVAICFFLVYRFGAALFSLFIGITLGTAVKPVVERARARGLPRWVSAVGVYVLLGAALAGIVLLVLPVLLHQAGELLAGAPRHFGRIRELLLDSTSHTLRRIGATMPSTLTITGAGVGAAAATPHAGVAGQAAAAAGAAALSFGEVFDYLGIVGRNLFAILVVLLLAFHWTLESSRRIRELVFFVPLDRRREVRAFIAAAEQKVGAYIRGQTLVCAIVGVMAFGLYTAIGLPYAFMLGLTYAVLEAVPVLGPLIGTAAAAMVALSVRPSLVVWVIAVAVFVQLVENYVIVPRVMNRTVGVNPLVTMLAITGFGSVLGVAGAVLAIPMAAIIQLMIDRFVLSADRPERAVRGRRDHLSVIRYDVRQVALDARKLLRGQAPRAPAGAAEKIEDAVEGIAVDLERLLDETGAPAR